MTTDLELCLDYLDDHLSVVDSTAFEQRLPGEPKLAELLIEVSREEVTIRDWANESVQPRLATWLRRRVLGGPLVAASVVLVLLVAVLFLVLPRRGGGLQARLAEARDAEWEDARSAPSVGDLLENGQRIALKRGTAELAYANGARVTLGGPGVFVVGAVEPPPEPNAEIVPVTHGHLERGTITVHCPPGAEGFTVEGPGVRVVDLGTRFKLDVDDAGESHTEVLEGRVQLFRLDHAGAVQSRRTLFAREVGRIDVRGIRVDAPRVAAPAENHVQGGSLEVVLGRTVERTREDFVADDYAFGPLQRFDETTGATTVRLPYGDRPALFGEVRGVLVDPDVASAEFHSADRTTDALLVYHLRFDEPIAAFRFTDARSEWELGERTVGGVEYSIDGDAWHTIREIAGPLSEAFDPFVADHHVAGLDTRELRLRYFTRAAEGAIGPIGERWLKLHLSGGPLYGGVTTPFFDHHLELTVQGK